MRDLHEQLRSLVSQHGTGIVDTAEQFRGALDEPLCSVAETYVIDI